MRAGSSLPGRYACTASQDEEEKNDEDYEEIIIIEQSFRYALKVMAIMLM